MCVLLWVTLACARTLSGSVVRTLRGGEGFPKIFCLVAPSLGLGGSLVIVAAVLASVSASSLPGAPLWPGTHRRVVRHGRALKDDLRWWVTRDRRSIALSSNSLSVQIVSEWSGWLAVVHSKPSCMAVASSAIDEVNAAPRR